MADTAAIDATIEGWETVRRAFQTVIDAAESMPTTQQAIANLLVPAVRRLAPSRSGALKGSIGASPRGDGVTLAAGVVYGGVIEWGWRERGIRGRHFVARGVMSNQTGVLELYAKGLTDACAEAQRGG